MGYKVDTLKGLYWMSLLRGVTRIIAIVKIIILARILGPLELGTFAVASISLAFMETLSETGINAVLVQENEDYKKYIDTAWIISILRGFLIFILLFAVSPFLSKYFNNPDITVMIRVISLIPLIRGLLNPSIIQLQNHLLFKKDFSIRTVLYIADALVSIILAIIYRNAICIVIGQIVYALLELFISWWKFSPKPKLIFNYNRFKGVVKRGRWVTLSGVFDYIFHNLDDLVIGKIMGGYYLGLYSTAYKIAILPITEGGEVVSRVTFPIFVKMSNDSDRLKSAYRKVTLLLSAILIPFTLIFLIFGREIIFLLLGYKWLEVVPVLKVLSIHGTLRAISGFSSVLYLSIKKQQYITVITFISMLVLVVTITPFVNRFGIMGGGYSSLLGTLAVIPLVYVWYKKIFTYENPKS